MKIAFGPCNYDGYTNFGINYKSFADEVDDGECIEIYAPEILDYIPSYAFNEFFSLLLSKMRHGCEITVGGTDLFETAKQILRGDYNTEEMNKTLYGTKDNPKLGQYGLHVLSSIFLSKGMKILAKKLDSNKMYIKAQRL